jgi:hypothetical protein
LSDDFAEVSVFCAAAKIGLNVAVGAADEVAAVPQAVGVSVTRIRSLVHDFATFLARGRSEVPVANSEVVTRSRVGVVSAILTAAVFKVVPLALNVVVTRNVGGVDEGAAKSAGRLRNNPSAHGVVLAVRSDGVVGAQSFAALSIRVPDTVGVGIARRLRVVAVAALEGAVSIVDLALGEGSAGSVEVGVGGEFRANTHGTSSGALGIDIIPVAVGVIDAGSLSHVAEFARTTAFVFSGALGKERGFVDEVQPFAVRISDAGSVGRVLIAALGAALIVGEPLATRVDQAVAFLDSAIARRAADEVVQVEQAARILLALTVDSAVLERALGGARVVEPRASVVEAALILGEVAPASSLANVGGGRPDALAGRIVGAGLFVVILGIASLGALSSCGIPFAEIRNFRASSGSKVLRAVACALGLERVPNATRIVVAGSLRRVLDLAAEDTLRIGMETVREGASFFGARRVGLVAAAERLALSGSTTDTTA